MEQGGVEADASGFGDRKAKFNFCKNDMKIGQAIEGERENSPGAIVLLNS
jgi:hypothetical protein